MQSVVVGRCIIPLQQLNSDVVGEPAERAIRVDPGEPETPGWQPPGRPISEWHDFDEPRPSEGTVRGSSSVHQSPLTLSHRRALGRVSGHRRGTL